MTPKEVIDPCCGSRMFYFDKKNQSVMYCDNRKVSETLCDGRTLDVNPDVIADVTELPFDDESFNLVVFDPPHLEVGNGWQVEKYGKLPPDWKKWMKKAFSECWRVLAKGGTLIFKWYEYHIKLAEVLQCAPSKPLLGNKKPHQSKTHWIVFYKQEEEE